MRTIKFLLLTLTLTLLAFMNSNAQNYKAPAIDAAGKITDEKGKHIGWVTKEGVIKDSAGTKIAHVDSEGSLVDAKSGKKLGKAQKNGNYLSHTSKTSDGTMTVSEPSNGTCEVKDKDGKVVLLVHESYKQYGACAYHCLQMKKEHKDMKMK